MKYFMIYEPDPNAPPPTTADFARLGAYTEKMIASGTVTLNGAILKAGHGRKLTRTKGQLKVSDGPFVETKELIAGFAVVTAKDHEEALALAAEFMEVAGDGTAEILPIYEHTGDGDIPAPEAGGVNPHRR